jgi:hypothetical protein
MRIIFISGPVIFDLLCQPVMASNLLLSIAGHYWLTKEIKYDWTGNENDSHKVGVDGKTDGTSSGICWEKFARSDIWAGGWPQTH